MAAKDLSPRLCWKSIAVLSALVVALIVVILFSHYHLATDNHPPSQPLVPKARLRQ